MTFLELCETVRKELGILGPDFITVSGVGGDYARIVNAVAEAEQLIVSKWPDWKFMWTTVSFNTVAGQSAYTLSGLSITDHRRYLMDRWICNGTTDSWSTLTQKPYVQYTTKYSLGTQTPNKPTYIFLRPDDALVLWPKPDAIYAITGERYKAHTRLTSDGSQTPIPNRWNRAIISLAKQIMAESFISSGVKGGDVLFKVSASEHFEWMSMLENDQLANKQNIDMFSPDEPITVRAE